MFSTLLLAAVGLVDTSVAFPHYPRGTNSSALFSNSTLFSNSSAHINAASASGSAAYLTTADGSSSLSSWTAPVKGSNPPSGGSRWQLSIDDTSSGHKQSIVGFGAAMTDGSVTSINSLSSSTKQQLLNDLVQTSNFNLWRHTIGASDMSGDPAYTYDDNGNNADPNLNGFNLGGRGTAMAQLLASMKSLNSGLKILGSPWSPPAWMKVGQSLLSTNQNNLRDHYLNNDGPDYSSSFAQYFVKYIQAFAKFGAQPDFITLQNEPLNSVNGYPTMYMFDYEQARLIQNNVGPALSNAGLSTSIWGFDHNTDTPDYPTHVVQNAGQYVNTIAWHCYNGANWGELTKFHNQFPNVDQYMTECWTPPGRAWGGPDSPANWTVGSLQNWARGAISWNLATYSDGSPYLSSGGCQGSCLGLVTIENGGYTFNQAYYVLNHFSRFMPRGSTVLSGTGSYTYPDGTGVESVSSINSDGSRVVVISNKLNSDVYVELSTKSGESWAGPVPQQSMVTWTLPAAS